MHAPIMPYWAKLLFASVVGAGLFTWLFRAGRLEPSADVERPDA
jgi:hypothetical protein